MEGTLLRFVNEEILAGLSAAVGAEDEIVLDGTLDSLGVTRLIGFVEEEYSLSIPPEDVTIENFRTIRTIAGYLRRRLDAESVA